MIKFGMPHIYRKYDDILLISLLQKGDKKAFDEIYERYWDKLFVVAANRTGDPHIAQDIVQDIMVRLWKNQKDILIKTNLGAYLATAVKYEVINHLSKQKRQENYVQRNLSETGYSTEYFLDFISLQERLSVLVKALPEKCRMVFELSREHGYSQKQIANHLNISENTVEFHLKRALKSLRAGLRNFIFSLLI